MLIELGVDWELGVEEKSGKGNGRDSLGNRNYVRPTREREREREGNFYGNLLWKSLKREGTGNEKLVQFPALAGSTIFIILLIYIKNMILFCTQYLHSNCMQCFFYENIQEGIFINPVTKALLQTQRGTQKYNNKSVKQSLKKWDK